MQLQKELSDIVLKKAKKKRVKTMGSRFYLVSTIVFLSFFTLFIAGLKPIETTEIIKEVNNPIEPPDLEDKIIDKIIEYSKTDDLEKKISDKNYQNIKDAVSDLKKYVDGKIGKVDDKVNKSNAKIDDLDKELTKQTSRINNLTERTWLLAISNNENFTILQKNSQEPLIIFDTDWKINKIPQHIQLSSEGRKDLEKNLKK